MDVNKILHSKFQMNDNGTVNTIGDIYTNFNLKVDIEALKNSDFFPAMERMMEPALGVPDERSPEIMSYWAKRGMVKEFHGYDRPMDWTEYEEKTGYRWNAENYNIKQNEHKIWTSFVPVSAFDPKNKDRKYPLVFALHGAQNTVFLTEGWGYVHEAAIREWIVIIPSMVLDDILEEILNEAKKMYPIDESRIYASGFSYGGWASNRLGNQRTNIFAAVGPCGCTIDNAYIAGDSDDREPLPPFDGVYRAQVPATYMPIINIYGNYDGERFPFYNFSGKRFGLSTMETPDDIINGINHWARVNKAAEINVKDVLALKGQADISEAERDIGLPLTPDCRESYVADGVQYHIADIKSEDGVARIRIVAEMNIPHWPTPEMAKQVFRFFSHFSRDPVTKESIYTD